MSFPIYMQANVNIKEPNIKMSIQISKCALVRKVGQAIPFNLQKKSYDQANYNSPKTSAIDHENPENAGISE